MLGKPVANALAWEKILLKFTLGSNVINNTAIIYCGEHFFQGENTVINYCGICNTVTVSFHSIIITAVNCFIAQDCNIAVKLH